MTVETFKSKREINREKKISMILAAARELMEEAGEDAVTLRKLARKTGLSTNTIYAQFGKNRDDIIKAIITDALSDVGYADDCELTLDKPGKAPWDLAVEQFLENPEFYRVVTLFKTKEEPFLEAQRNLTHLKDKTIEILEQAIREKLLSDKTDLTFLVDHFIHAFLGYAHQWARYEIEDEKFRRQMLYAIYTALILNATPKGRRRFVKFLVETTGQGNSLEF